MKDRDRDSKREEEEGKGKGERNTARKDSDKGGATGGVEGVC